jgi:DNA primase
MSEQQQEKFRICEWWLYRGFALLPVQRNKKFLFQGYGEHKKKISTSAEAQELIEKYPLANIAVLGDKDKIILDFDETGLYDRWANEHPEMSKTYTERTPGGGAHVFAYGPHPYGMIWVHGVELKNICVVYPSVADDKPYARGAGEIIKADEFIFSSLSKIGTPTAYLLNIQRKRQERKPYSSATVIEQIKAHYDIHHVYKLYRPEWEKFKDLNEQTVKCPFHEDHHASMYLNNRLGVYKCHACGAHGDVINLYAHFENITNREAIDRMKRSLQAVTS